MLGANATEATHESSGGPATPAMIRFGRAICGDLQQAERREWWLANGLGGYAAGTVASSLNRRYHGLLIAALDPPLGRRLVWAKADADLVDGEQIVLARVHAEGVGGFPQLCDARLLEHGALTRVLTVAAS